ncbi:hypothetical protein BOH78_2938 [Pichia kudriavzevii]|uniref:Uncharacterized protein n=1 Tax=Pichia kudriavzevii TaxID=4909 RepID=A0A1V2LL99_PICKU|nr:hypothetical protein BOH78_2938 [Pichia kudriavzevii]
MQLCRNCNKAYQHLYNGAMHFPIMMHLFYPNSSTFF